MGLGLKCNPKGEHKHKTPKPVYILLYIGGIMIVCLMKVTGFSADTRWINKRVWGPLVIKKLGKKSKRKKLYSIPTLVYHT